jgi:hypothetical protein
VKNEPLNIYFDDQYQLKIKFNSENCTIEIERIHVGSVKFHINENSHRQESGSEGDNH